jgi:predicted MFS family arabinose efflux permease
MNLPFRRRPSLEEADELRRDWSLFAGMTFLFMFGFTVYAGVFQNFFREVLRGDELGLGGLESLREIPGLIAALMAGMLVALAESRVAALGLFITGLGIALTGAVTGYWPLVAVSVFWSVGFHLWSTVAPAITLTLAKGLEGGRHLGRMKSVGAVATILGLGLASLLSLFAPELPYWVYFLFGGASICAGAALATMLSHHASGGRRQRLIFRREYGLYYLLTFLEGCRRQVFSIFALFTLIKVYGAPLSHVLLLSFLNAVLSALTSPAMGRYIDRVGERKPLTMYAVGIIGIFLGYATIPSAGWLYALYVFDNVLFTFSIGLNTYLHRIVRPGELTPSLAMGTTMNHVAAVGLPIAGALVWKQTGDYRLPFLIGAGLAVIALLATQKLPKAEPEPATA